MRAIGPQRHHADRRHAGFAQLDGVLDALVVEAALQQPLHQVIGDSLDRQAILRVVPGVESGIQHGGIHPAQNAHDRQGDEELDETDTLAECGMWNVEYGHLLMIVTRLVIGGPQSWLR